MLYFSTCQLLLPNATANCDRLTSQNISNKLENMKWLILLLFLFLMAVLIMVIRYRRQIKTGWQVWKMFRQMRQMGKTNVKQHNKRETLKDVPLVRCEKCGKWISPEGALKLRQEKYYCSSVCMEKAARLQSLVD
jgi:hypothetical protein